MYRIFRSGATSVWGAILYLALGLVLVLFPDMSGTFFVRVLAVGAAVYGLRRLFCYFRSRKEGSPAGGEAFLAIIALAFALFCILQPHALLSFLPLVLGLLCLLDGIVKIPVAVAFVRERQGALVPALISTVLPLALGVLLLAKPFSAAKVAIMVFGVGLMLDGASDLVTAILARRYEDH